MCEPISLSLMALAAGGLGAYGQIQQGNFANKMAKRENEMANQRAAMAEDIGDYKAGQQAKLYAQQLGQGRAAYAANGVLLEGADSSAVDWQAGLASEHAADMAMIRSEAEMEAWGLRAGGQAALTQGKMAKTASAYNAAGTALGSVSQSALTYKTLKG